MALRRKRPPAKDFHLVSVTDRSPVEDEDFDESVFYTPEFVRKMKEIDEQPKRTFTDINELFLFLGIATIN